MSKLMRLFNVVLLVFIGLSSLWAGGDNDQSGSSSGQALPPGVKSMDKFTIVYFDFNDDPSSPTNVKPEYYKNVETLYKKMYPNATIEFTGTGAGVNGLDYLQMQLASGTAADVFEHQTRLAAFARAGYLYDMSDQPWASDVLEGMDPDVKYNKKTYGAPIGGAGGWGIFYNKKIYEDQLGLEAPGTFQELLDNCEKIKKAGYIPFVIGGADGWPFQGLFLSFLSFLFGSNRNFPMDLYSGKASLAGREMNNLFNAIKTLSDRGYFHEGSMSMTWNGQLQSMREGKVVMGFFPAGGQTGVETPGSGIELGYFYIPDNNGYNCIPILADTVVSVNAKYRFASTRGVDLVACFAEDSSIHIKQDNTAPSGFKNKKINYETSSGGRRYQEAFDRGPIVLQATSWLPSSVFDLYQQIVSSIISGNGFTQQMLDNMQRAYEADKANVNMTN
jgi:raffinose/stachyose/melibiose transport system substrate-binding protein